MKYRPLGSTGVRVSSLCLGTLMLGSWGGTDAEQGVKIIRRALDAGVNVVDTADSYSRGESEEIVGRALADPGVRDHVVLATKVGTPMGPDPNWRGGSRRWILREVEHSLRRLRTDRIDLYQLHRPDPGTDLTETLEALSTLVRDGKVRYIGTSSLPAHQIVEARWLAERAGLSRFVTEQPPYSLLARGVEADVLPVCARYGMGVATWSPLAGGWLTGRDPAEIGRSARAGRWPRRYDLTDPANVRKADAVAQLSALAREAGISMVHLALAFTLTHPAVSATIVGPRTLEQLDDQLPAADLTLSTDVLDRIDRIVPPGTTFHPDDGGWRVPELTDPALRRRR
jgi:aryl-alcohol dehydrogenase-like predicted oxidoreductase